MYAQIRFDSSFRHISLQSHSFRVTHSTSPFLPNSKYLCTTYPGSQKCYGYEYNYDRERCVSRAMNFGPVAFQKVLADLAAEDDPDTRRAKVHSDFFSRACAGVAFYKESVAQCFECMRVCPVGRQERKLK